MSQYVCPLCGSQYMKRTTEEGVLIFTVGYDYAINMIQDQTEDGTQDIDQESAIHCAACSWQGIVSQLTESDLDN